MRGQRGRQEEIRKNDKETRNRQEDRTSGTLVGKENNGWNREAQNGKGQGLKAKNADANVLEGGRKGRELQNPGGKGEQGILAKSWRNLGKILPRRKRNDLRNPGENLAKSWREQGQKETNCKNLAKSWQESGGANGEGQELKSTKEEAKVLSQDNKVQKRGTRKR